MRIRSETTLQMLYLKGEMLRLKLTMPYITLSSPDCKGYLPQSKPDLSPVKLSRTRTA